MTDPRLKNLSRGDLLFVLERMQQISHGDIDHHIVVALIDLNYMKKKHSLDEAEKVNKLWDEAMQRYQDILQPYDGWKIINIPRDVLEKADAAWKQADMYSKRFLRLLKLEETSYESN